MKFLHYMIYKHNSFTEFLKCIKFCINKVTLKNKQMSIVDLKGTQLHGPFKIRKLKGYYKNNI